MYRSRIPTWEHSHDRDCSRPSVGGCEREGHGLRNDVVIVAGRTFFPHYGVRGIAHAFRRFATDIPLWPLPSSHVSKPLQALRRPSRQATCLEAGTLDTWTPPSPGETVWWEPRYDRRLARTVMWGTGRRRFVKRAAPSSGGGSDLSWLQHSTRQNLQRGSLADGGSSIEDEDSMR
jgi:hypothetical protein